jgi:NAD-dependent SIR2 family protein deacetylase
MIDAAARMIVFTGAGISTESGVPDFRSPGGVWSRMKPIYFQDFVASEEARRESWTRAFSGAAGWTGAKPNNGHYAVARLVACGKTTMVITQNVDNLHQDAGTPRRQHHRAARQRQLRHLSGMWPEARTRGSESALSRTRRHPGLPCLLRDRQDGHHLVRPADARSRHGPGRGRQSRL